MPVLLIEFIMAQPSQHIHDSLVERLSQAKFLNTSFDISYMCTLSRFKFIHTIKVTSPKISESENFRWDEIAFMTVFENEICEPHEVVDRIFQKILLSVGWSASEPTD